MRKEIKKEMIFRDFLPEDVENIGLYKKILVKTTDGEYFIGSLIKNHIGTVFFNSGSFNYSMKEIALWAFMPTVA
jgi:hypothetical protein